MFSIFSSLIVFWQFFDDFFCMFGSLKMGNIWSAKLYFPEIIGSHDAAQKNSKNIFFLKKNK